MFRAPSAVTCGASRKMTKMRLRGLAAACRWLQSSRDRRAPTEGRRPRCGRARTSRSPAAGRPRAPRTLPCGNREAVCPRSSDTRPRGRSWLRCGTSDAGDPAAWPGAGCWRATAAAPAASRAATVTWENTPKAGWRKSSPHRRRSTAGSPSLLHGLSTAASGSGESLFPEAVCRFSCEKSPPTGNLA